MSSPAPTQFGKYELLDRIAAGGMAEIFRARYEPAPGVTKQVVIKRILPHYAENKAFIAMFTNEAKIVMGLSHGNIAQVFDFGVIDGDSFLAMEFVDGPPLSKVVRRAHGLGMPVLPPEFAAFICAEVLKGLHYAHTRIDETGRPLKIVHRDVSPQNVLISYEGQVKLVDFGIARARNAGSDDSAGNAVQGKYAYFSPEQAKSKELDARSDIFATGTVLYELLTGQLPFQGRMMDVLTRIVRGDFIKPRERNPRIPPELERIVLKAMALERNDRYQTAEAFQQDLNRFLSNNHPEFTGAMLTSLQQLLFEDELVKEGRPVQLAREFVERAQKWKEPLPPPAQPGQRDDSEAPTEVVGLDEVKLGPGPSLERLPPQPKRAGWLPSLALLLAAAGVGYGAVTLVQRAREATLEITSVPAGAEIILDGRRLEATTPTQVTRLRGDRSVRVEIGAPGYDTWVHEVPLKPGQHLVVAAALTPTPPPEPPPEQKAVEPPPAPPPPRPAPNDVRWPLGSFELDVAVHRIELARVNAAAIPLDPAKTYRVRLQPAPAAPTWGFYVVSDGGTQPGLLGADALQIRSASAIWVFHVPHATLGFAGREETKPRTLSLLIEGTRKPQQRSLTPARVWKPQQRVTLSGLSTTKAYVFTAKQTIPPATARKDGPPLTRVLIGSAHGLTVATVDEPVTLEGISSCWFAILDDAADGETGRLTIETTETKPSKRRHR